MIKLLNLNFDLLGEIDDYESLLFTNRHNAVSEFEMRVNRYANNANKLQKDTIIYLDSKRCGLVEYLSNEIDEEGQVTDNIIVKGCSLLKLLDRRITIPDAGQATIKLTGNGETVIKQLITKCCIAPADVKRKISLLNIPASKNLGSTITYESRHKNLLEEVLNIANLSNVGVLAELDYANKKINIDVFNTVNRSVNQAVNSPVIFSAQFDNILNQNYTYNQLDYRSMAYVAGQGEGASRTIIEVNNSATGLDRRELFVDARDLEDASLLPQRGAEALDELPIIQSFEGNVNDNTFRFREHYNLGDIVTVQNKEWGITVDTYVSEVIETWESDGYSQEVVFGEKPPTLIDKIRKIK